MADTQFYCDRTHSYHDTEDEAKDALRETIDFDDIIGNSGCSIEEMIKELARLESPLFDKYYEEAFAVLCEEEIHEEEDDGEIEEQFEQWSKLFLEKVLTNSK